MLNKIPTKRNFFLIRLDHLIVGGPFGYNKILSWLFIISIFALCRFQSTGKEFAFNLALSYFSAYIFYFLTILVPEINRQYSMLNFLVWKVFKINEPFDHLCAAIGAKPISDDITDWENFCTSILQLSNPGYHYFRVFEFFETLSGKQWIHRYLNYQECLESLQNNMASELDKINSIVPFFDHEIMIHVNSFAEKIEKLNERIVLLQLSSPTIYNSQYAQILWELNYSLKNFNSTFNPFLNK